MSFFKKIFGIIASFGFVAILLIVSFLLVILTNKEDTHLDENQEIAIYLKEEIKEFDYKTHNNDLNLTVIFKEDKKEDYCLSYAYYYYDTYDYKINLIVKNSDNYLFITVINDEKSSLIKKTI